MPRVNREHLQHSRFKVAHEEISPTLPLNPLLRFDDCSAFRSIKDLGLRPRHISIPFSFGGLQAKLTLQHLNNAARAPRSSTLFPSLRRKLRRTRDESFGRCDARLRAAFRSTAAQPAVAEQSESASTLVTAAGDTASSGSYRASRRAVCQIAPEVVNLS